MFDKTTIVLIASPVLALITYYLRAKTDVWRLSKQADITVSTTPFNVLQQVLNNREKENTVLRDWINTIVTNHLRDDRVDRAAMIQALSLLTADIRGLTTLVRESQADAASDRKDLAEAFTALRIDVGRPR
jgi:hypothetical protein